MNHTRLESIFHKKYVPPMQAHKSWHTHASHVHTHNTMYAHVYTYTHCRRKCHLAKFCYDRLNTLNFTNKFVWVRKGANPMDPMRYGYQNSLLFYLMYVWALTWREGIGALMVDAFVLDGYYFGYITFKKVWWEDHHGLEI